MYLKIKMDFKDGQLFKVMTGLDKPNFLMRGNEHIALEEIFKNICGKQNKC
jgi:hypothetical protein